MNVTDLQIRNIIHTLFATPQTDAKNRDLVTLWQQIGEVTNEIREIQNFIPAPATPTFSLISVTSSTTITALSGYNIYLIDCSLGNVTLTFPDPATTTAIYGVKKIDSTMNRVIFSPYYFDNESLVIRFKNTELDVFSNGVSYYVK